MRRDSARGKANLRRTVGGFENCGPPSSARPLAETNKEPPCSEIEVIIRDFESGPGVFADDSAFAFGSRRDIELGARILHNHCARWGMMPHTAGKTVAMYFVNYSRALRRPPGQCGPFLHRVGNETAFQNKKQCTLGSQWLTCASVCPMRRSPRSRSYGDRRGPCASG